MTTDTTVASTESRLTRFRGPAAIWRLGSAAAGIAAATNLAIFAVARAADAPFLVAFKTNQAKSPIAAAVFVVRVWGRPTSPQQDSRDRRCSESPFALASRAPFLWV